MKYIIMADGEGRRWNNFGGVPKHFAKVGGETLIGRTVRLLKRSCPLSTIIITSHDLRYDFPGTLRHEPQNNHTEIDRFTEELIADDTCFLYGDTWYSEESIQMILQHPAAAVTFFGRGSDIFAVKVRNGAMFRKKVNEARQILRTQGRKEISACGCSRIWSVRSMPKSMTIRKILIHQKIISGFLIIRQHMQCIARAKNPPGRNRYFLARKKRRMRAE